MFIQTSTVKLKQWRHDMQSGCEGNTRVYSNTLFREGRSKHAHLVLLTGHTRIHLPKPINSVILQKSRRRAGNQPSGSPKDGNVNSFPLSFKSNYSASREEILPGPPSLSGPSSRQKTTNRWTSPVYAPNTHNYVETCVLRLCCRICQVTVTVLL